MLLSALQIANVQGKGKRGDSHFSKSSNLEQVSEY